MLSEEYEQFRNKYQSPYRFPDAIAYSFFHTTPITNLASIYEMGLLSVHESGCSKIGLGLGPICSKHFVRLFHVDKTPFLYDRFNKIGGSNIALLVISHKILDEKSVSLVGMSTHGLAYYGNDYFQCYFLQKRKNSNTNELIEHIESAIPKATIYADLSQSTSFFAKLTEASDLPAQGNDWSRGEVLFSTRAAYPGNGAGQWGNIRAAEILIFPKIPAKYIIGVACTVEALNKIKPIIPDIQFYDLNNQGIRSL